MVLVQPALSVICITYRILYSLYAVLYSKHYSTKYVWFIFHTRYCAIHALRAIWIIQSVYSRISTQLSLTNCMMDLCNMPWHGWPIKCPSCMCYHADFSCSASQCVAISRGYQNWALCGPALARLGVADPLIFKNAHSPCVTVSYLIVLCQRM